MNELIRDMVEKYAIQQGMEDEFKKDVILYAQLKCKEQREICSKSFPSHEYPEISYEVFYAPEPEFD